MLGVASTEEQMRNRHQNYRPDRSRSQREQERICVHNSQFSENPPSNHRPNQPKHNIANAPKAPASRDFTGQPSRNEPNHQPPKQTSLPLHHNNVFLQHRERTQPGHLSSSYALSTRKPLLGAKRGTCNSSPPC